MRKDRWIPSLANGKITSNLTTNTNNDSFKVCDLISSNKQWNHTKLSSLFLNYETEAIKRVPIDSLGTSDSRYWRYSKKGLYTVKSAYWKTHNCNHDNNNDQAGSTSCTPIPWSRIWNLKLPPKVKIFLWKTAQNAIAAEANLKAHHVSCQSRCVLCGYFNADTNHALFFCQEVKEA